MRKLITKVNMRHAAALLLSVILLLGVGMRAQAAGVSGACGEGVSWSLDGGVLTISGSGAMQDYQEYSHAPWYSYRESINRIVVEEGVTHVGDFAFRECVNVKTAVLPDSVTEIGGFAFYDCRTMETVRMSNRVESLGRSCFELCRSLKSISLPGTLRTIRTMAFYRCESLVTVTVPASVNSMEPRVFTYCSGLRSATVLANIGQLPYWTFYGCYSLASVSLSSSITFIGAGAFENCDELKEASYGGTGEDADSVKEQIEAETGKLEEFKPGQSMVIVPENQVSSTENKTENGETVTVEKDLFEGPNSVITTETTQGQSGAIVKTEAVLKNELGWDDVEKQQSAALSETGRTESIETKVYLQWGSVVRGADLARFAGQNMRLVIHTNQGVVWYINCKDLQGVTLLESYDFSCVLQPLAKLNRAQTEAVGKAQAYKLVFNGTINFKTALKMPVGNPRYPTSLFYKTGGKYQLLQKVLTDDNGYSFFYLQDVEAKAECLLGINVTTAAANNGSNSSSGNSGGGNGSGQVLIPDSANGGYLPVEWIDHDYYISGIKSSWGISIGQLTWILVGVIVVSALVVGIIMRLQFKKNKDDQPPKPARKRKIKK